MDPSRRTDIQVFWQHAHSHDRRIGDRGCTHRPLPRTMQPRKLLTFNLFPTMAVHCMLVYVHYSYRLQDDLKLGFSAMQPQHRWVPRSGQDERGTHG